MNFKFFSLNTTLKGDVTVFSQIQNYGITRFEIRKTVLPSWIPNDLIFIPKEICFFT